MASQSAKVRGGALFVAAAILLGLLLVGTSACRRDVVDGELQARRLAQAEADYDAGRFAEAERTLAAVVRREPANVYGLRLLALALAAQGKDEMAIEEYGRLVRLQPKDDVALYRMALLERVLGRTRSAETHLEMALTSAPASPTYADELARTKMALGKYREAAGLWGRVLSEGVLAKKDRKDVLMLQAQAYQAAKDYGNARRALASARAEPSR